MMIRINRMLKMIINLHDLTTGNLKTIASFYNLKYPYRIIDFYLFLLFSEVCLPIKNEKNAA